MRFQSYINARRQLLILIFAVLCTVCKSDENAGTQPKDVTKTLSKDELGKKIKDLLIKRPERPDVSDSDSDFEELFKELNVLATGMSDDFEFDVAAYGPPVGHSTLGNTQAMTCLKSSDQFKHFMKSVSEIMKNLKDELLDDINDSKDADDKLDTQNNDDDNKHDDDSDDDHKKVTEHQSTTTDQPDSRQDDKVDFKNSTDTNTSKDTDDIHRSKRDTEADGFDLDEVLDRLEDDDMKCLTGFVSKGDEKFLCRRFSHKSSGIFTKIMAAGAECGDYLLRDKDDDDDDDDDDDLDDSHQMAILKMFKNKKSTELSDNDVKKLLRLAPGVIDDDFLDDLPETLFKQNLHTLGRLAHQGKNPGLRYTLRRRLTNLDLGKLSADDVKQIGPGFLSLTLDQIQALNGQAFLDSDIDDLFDDGDDDDDDDSSKDKDIKQNKVKHNDDDEDDDDDDDIKLAIGQRIKEAIKQSGLQKNQIGRTLHYLHHDLDFVKSIEPDDLLDSLDDIRHIDYDFDDAKAVLDRMLLSPHFPPVSSLTAYNLTHIGKLLRGMDIETLSLLNKDALEDVLDDINVFDFDDHQAQQLLENMGYIMESKNYGNLNAPEIKKLGTLFRGMPTESIALMKDDAIEDTLDDFDDLDLSDTQKKIIVEKVRRNDKISPKFLNLKNFAEIISLDDLDDFDDDDLRLRLNTSSRIKWRLPQAALLADRYKLAKGVRRLRPSDLAQMKYLAIGLQPEELNGMIVTQDDVFDIAEELKEVQEELTSGQIDELTERFYKISGIDSDKKVVIDEPEAMQGSHMLAYLAPELFEKLEFTNAGKLAFIHQVSKMSSHKMSRKQVQFLTEKMLDIMEDADSAESIKDKTDDRESRRLRSLGQMALGLTPSQIGGFSGKAILDNLDILRNLALAKAQAKAVLDKMKDIADDWQCQSNILARVGSLLQHYDGSISDDCDLKEEQVSSLFAAAKGMEKRRSAIQKRLDEGFSKENDDATDDSGEKKLVDAVVFAAARKISVRSRRAAPVAGGALTCDVLIRLGSSARMVDVQQIETMPNEEVKRCLPQLGAVSGWSHDVLKVLVGKMKTIYGDVSSWTSKIVAAAGSIIAGLSPAEINVIGGLSGVDVLNSVGKHGRLSNEQLKSGFRRWMTLTKKNDVTDITAGEFTSLTEFVCGLEVAEIGRIQDATFKRSLNTIGRSSSCTQEQSQAYVNKAVSVYGSEVNKWHPFVVADMGYLLGALNGEQIKLINSKQLALISPKVIEALPKNGISGMSTAQLNSFSTNQANAVTQAQFQALTSEQQKALSSKATLGFSSSNSPSGNKNGNSAARNALYGFVVIATVVFSLVLQ